LAIGTEKRRQGKYCRYAYVSMAQPLLAGIAYFCPTLGTLLGRYGKKIYQHFLT